MRQLRSYLLPRLPIVAKPHKSSAQPLDVPLYVAKQNSFQVSDSQLYL